MPDSLWPAPTFSIQYTLHDLRRGGHTEQQHLYNWTLLRRSLLCLDLLVNRIGDALRLGLYCKACLAFGLCLMSRRGRNMGERVVLEGGGKCCYGHACGW